MKTYQYTSPEQTVVAVIDEDGISRMSGLADALVPEGELVLPYTSPPKTYAQVWDKIKALRDAKTQDGGCRVGENWFHSDTFSRTQQIGLTLMGNAMPPGIMWKTMAGTFVEMTPTLAAQIFAAVAAQDTAIFAHAEALRAQAQADPDAVDITVGWPTTYGGV